MLGGNELLVRSLQASSPSSSVDEARVLGTVGVLVIIQRCIHALRTRVSGEAIPSKINNIRGW